MDSDGYTITLPADTSPATLAWKVGAGHVCPGRRCSYACMLVIGALVVCDAICVFLGIYKL